MGCRRRLFALALSACLLPAGPAAARDVQVGPDDILLIRHAKAPGVGDPPNVRLDDCATQRNLSDEGRDEARRIGEELRRRKVRVALVLTSQWCRTRETARLAFPSAQVRDETAFNSWFGREPVESESQLARARQILARWRGPGVLVVVTHAVNINALVGEPTASGEAVVLHRDDRGEWKVAGRIRP